MSTFLHEDCMNGIWKAFILTTTTTTDLWRGPFFCWIYCEEVIKFWRNRKILARYQRWIQKNILLWRKLFLARIKEEVRSGSLSTYWPRHPSPVQMIDDFKNSVAVIFFNSLFIQGFNSLFIQGFNSLFIQGFRSSYLLISDSYECNMHFKLSHYFLVKFPCFLKHYFAVG